VKNILVVDDQSTIRQLLDISLASDERRIFQAASGETALEILRRMPFDLVIMDIMMPGGMDGFETVQKMRGDAAVGHCPVLILTAKDQQAERDRAAELGVDGYLAKPFKLNDLCVLVDNLLW
jgi:two-component system response regulator MprA